MLLFDNHYLAAVGRMRYMQATYERGSLRNPDSHVAKLLSPSQRLYATLNGRLRIGRIRRQPFYCYLVARTRFYDNYFQSKSLGECKRLLNIGAGTDTRAHRFRTFLDSGSIDLLECDLASAIALKQAKAARVWAGERVNYQAIDLNSASWPRLEAWLDAGRNGRCRVMLEGVSQYIERSRFPAFLRLLARKLPNGSSIAYDFKLAGANDALGKSDSVLSPFRLPRDREAITAFHNGLGYIVRDQIFSDELTRKSVDAGDLPSTKLFDEDGLVVLEVSRNARAAHRAAESARA